LSSSATDALCKDVEVGIYYGWAWLDSERVPREMVMSIGWNPFYKNTVRTAEVHILHEYEHDFYDHELRIIVLGYIRPELDYTTVEALVNDIRIDIQVARNGLERPVYAAFAHHAFFH
jgi:riboflavin kinase